MGIDMSGVRIATTKPRRKVAQLLGEMGIRIRAVEEDEGNVDRYIVSKRVAIERRTGSALVRGIMEKTLFTSAIYLREHFRLPILIVEGEVNYTYGGFDPQAVRGALSSMMLLYGLNVLHSPSREETAHLIAMIARQEQVGIPEISLIPKRKAVDLADQQRRVIEMLPGSGMVMARRLLQHFGSVRRVVNATREELLDLKGIGAKKVADMEKVLSAEYESVDTERDLEDAIEAEPTLLFNEGQTLVARQLYMFTAEGRRQFVDLVFADPARRELILIELKRGRITSEHYLQLRRYLDAAPGAKALRKLLAAAKGLRGVLATVTEGGHHRPSDPQVTVQVVDRAETLAVLKRLRNERLAAMDKARP